MVVAAAPANGRARIAYFSTFGNFFTFIMNPDSSTIRESQTLYKESCQGDDKKQPKCIKMVSREAIWLHRQHSPVETHAVYFPEQFAYNKGTSSEAISSVGTKRLGDTQCRFDLMAYIIDKRSMQSCDNAFPFNPIH
jgi:hypothetical protein